MATSSKQSLIRKIDDMCKVMIPAHITPRFACIKLTDENFIYHDQRIHAVLIGHLASLRDDGKALWVPLKVLSTQELKEVIKHVQAAMKNKDNVRAINPFWFIGNDCGEWLHKVIKQSYEDYLKTIQS